MSDNQDLNCIDIILMLFIGYQISYTYILFLIRVVNMI